MCYRLFEKYWFFQKVFVESNLLEVSNMEIRHMFKSPLPLWIIKYSCLQKTFFSVYSMLTCHCWSSYQQYIYIYVFHYYRDLSRCTYIILEHISHADVLNNLNISHTHKYMHIHKHTHSYTYTHKDTHTNIQNKHTHTNAHTYIHKHMHTHTLTQTHTHKYTPNIHTQADAHTCIHTGTHRAYSQTHTNTCAHVCAHAHTHTHS